MDNKKRIILSILMIVIGIILLIYNLGNHKISGLVISNDNGIITIMNDSEVIYEFNYLEEDDILGKEATIYYRGKLEEDEKVKKISYDEYDLKTHFNKNDLFYEYYDEAIKKVKTLSMEEKIGQLLLVRYPDKNQIEEIKKYNLGGFVFYGKDFQNKSISEVKEMISNLQDNSKIPLLIAVDEEGGEVVRVSLNKNIVSSPFKSPSELYEEGGISAIKKDTINKSKILSELGINLNLAPVVDVTTDPNDFMYERSLKKDTKIVSGYAKEVIEASKGSNVSYTLKHFPGYGNNLDTHTGESIDNRTYDEILENDIPPFVSGINAGAEAILVSHNIVTSIENVPAIISVKAHNILHNDLKFSGIVITDDIYMGAVKDYDNLEERILLAGNDIIITTEYEKSFNNIKASINEGNVPIELIDRIVTKILAWKYYKNI